MNLGAPQSGVDLACLCPDEGISHTFLPTSEFLGFLFLHLGSGLGREVGEASRIQGEVQSGSRGLQPSLGQEGFLGGGSS